MAGERVLAVSEHFTASGPRFRAGYTLARLGKALGWP